MYFWNCPGSCLRAGSLFGFRFFFVYVFIVKPKRSGKPRWPTRRCLFFHFSNARTLIYNCKSAETETKFKSVDSFESSSYIYQLFSTKKHSKSAVLISRNGRVIQCTFHVGSNWIWVLPIRYNNIVHTIIQLCVHY